MKFKFKFIFKYLPPPLLALISLSSVSAGGLFAYFTFFLGFDLFYYVISALLLLVGFVLYYLAEKGS